MTYGNLMIGYVHGEMVHARFMQSVLDEQARSQAVVKGMFSEPYVDKVRNELVEAFLASHCEWFLSVDTDIILPACVFSRFRARDEPLIGALIYVNAEPPFPQIYQRIADMSTDGSGAFIIGQDFKPGELVKADGTGAGCLLVHRDVFEAIPGEPPVRWFQHEIRGKDMFGEDLVFCERAKAAGFQLYIDTAVHAGHIKPRVI